MNFTVNHTRAFAGSDVQIGITTTPPEAIRSVSVVFDGLSLIDVELLPDTESYSRAFAGVGSAGPQYEHALELTVTDQEGGYHRSVTGWTDPS